MKVTYRKKVLVEAEANPLENDAVFSDSDRLLKEALLKAVASETSAIVEYEQIQALEADANPKYAKAIHETLVDIKAEEEKHMAQLTECLKVFPEIDENFEKGEKEYETGEDEPTEETKESNEAIKESVEPNRLYKAEAIVDVISTMYQLSDSEYDDILSIFYTGEDELEAYEVDKGIQKFATQYELTPEEIAELEQAINNSIDPNTERQEDFKSDLDFDIDRIRNLAEESYTVAARDRLLDLALKLEQIEYNGDKDTEWRQDRIHTANNKKIIS